MKTLRFPVLLALFLAAISTAFAQIVGAPVIASVSSGQSVTEGTNVTLSVSVNGTTPFTYQWSKDGTVIAGATANLYSLVPARVADAGNYSVTITNAVGSVTSGTIVLSVSAATPPQLNYTPSGVSVYVGASFSLSASFSSSTALTYEWRRDGVVVASGVASSYSKNSAQPADAGTYTVTATNAAGSATSGAIVVTVLALSAPVITSPPRDQTVNTAAAFSFSISVNTGGSATSYQWSKDGVALSGATNASYGRNNAVAADAGSYTVAVLNAIGSVVSSPARLTVNPPTMPTVTLYNFSSPVAAGGQISLSASIGGTPPLAYQWMKNGAPVPGETGSSFSRSSVSVADAGSYTLVATNAQGSGTGGPARITVQSPRAPEILIHPGSAELDQAEGINLSVGVTGTPPLTYQWRKDGALIAGANSSTYSRSGGAASSDSGLYSVTISNAYGSVVSEAAQITVRTPSVPVFTTALVDRTAVTGTSFYLNAEVTPRLNSTTYVWRKGSVVLSGSGGPQLYLNGLSTDSGDYSVTVTNSSGSATSTAKVTMLPAPLPLITLHPASYTSLTSGATLSLGISVGPTNNNLTFQWYRNDVVLLNSNSSSYYTGILGPQDAGTYKVVVTSPAGSVTSADAVVTVDAATALPAITSSGGSRTITGGSSTSLQIVLGRAGTVQWQRDGVNVPNATGTTLNLNNLSLANTGTYTAVVTTSSGTFTSRPMTVSLLDFGSAPSFLSPPAPQTRNIGGSVSWSVAMSGEQPFTYQWRKDGIAIPGATNANYDLYPIVAAHAGKYSVAVTNRNGTTTSTDAAFTVLPEELPVIRTHPVSQTIVASNSLSLGVSMFSTVGLTYQWWKDGVVIPGAISSSYIQRSGTVTAGRYSVVVTNGIGSVRSREATITAGNPVALAPAWNGVSTADQVLFTGATLSLPGNLTGATAYQWHRDGLPLAGATASTLFLTNLQSSDSGTYVLLGTNVDGVTPGTVAQITVQTPAPGLPRIGTQPFALTVLPGNTATFTAGVGSNPAATYQWFRNGVAVPGATAVVLTLTNVQTAQAGRYTLVATNSFGSVTSAEALLTLGTPITFTDSPRSQSVSAGSPLMLSATIQSPGSVSYQWKKNGVSVPGATSSTLTFTPVRASDAGVYTLVVSNPEGSVESAPATLTVASSVFAGTYYGGFGTGDSFALHVSPEGTGTMLGVLTNFSEAIIGRGFAIMADGSFTFGAGGARSYGAYRVSGDTVTGKITGTSVAGRVVGRDVAFSGGLQTPGSTAALAGYYQAVPVSGMVGEVHAIAAPDGTLQLLAINPTGVRLSRGALSSTGAFSLSQPPLLYSGNLAAATGALTGSLQMIPASAVTFATAPAPGGPERLANVSARGLAGSDSSALIAGFVVSGTAPKDVLIRGVGPALTGFGVAGALANPRLKLFKGNTSLLENDDWGLGGFATQIASTTARVGGFPFAAGSQDAALIARLDPGSYSAQVTGATSATGVALVEVYDAADTLNATRLINLSTRGEVGTGGDILIVGVVVTGNAPKKILLRGIGPGLAAFGVPGTLVDPQLKLYRGSQLVAENDNWSTGADAALIAEAAVAVGAFALPAASKDAALLLYLAPGTYSAQLSGAGNTTGVGLVEAYEVP